MTGVSVLYFAALRDLAGKASEEVELPDGPVTVSGLRSLLEKRHLGLSGRLEGVRFAINEEFADEQASIAGGDVVALIPPVSGG